MNFLKILKETNIWKYYPACKELIVSRGNFSEIVQILIKRLYETSDLGLHKYIYFQHIVATQPKGRKLIFSAFFGLRYFAFFFMISNQSLLWVYEEIYWFSDSWSYHLLIWKFYQVISFKTMRIGFSAEHVSPAQALSEKGNNSKCFKGRVTTLVKCTSLHTGLYVC